MKNFIKFGVIALSLAFAVQANASSIEVSKDKQTVSLSMNHMGDKQTSVEFEIPENVRQELISYNVNVYRIKVDNSHEVSETGIYNENSNMNNIGKPVHSVSLFTPGGEVAFFNYESEQTYPKSISFINKTVKKDGTKSNESKITDVDMDSVKSGFSLSMIKVNKDKYVFFIQQTSLEQMNKFEKDNVIIEYPVVHAWEGFNTFNVPEGKVVRLDSGVYESQDQLYKNVYIISMKTKK